MSGPSTPRTPRTGRASAARHSGRDNLSSDFPSSPGLQYPSSPGGLGVSSPLPFTSPGFNVVHQPGQYAQTPIRHSQLHGSEGVSSPIGMPMASSPPMRSHLGSSNLRSDMSFGTPRDARGGVPETPRRRRGDVVSSPQVARHLAARGEPGSELASATPFPTSQDYDPSQVVKVVWGTAVEINEVIRMFKDFLVNYKQRHRIAKENPEVQSVTESENKPFYPQLLEQA
ncbi:hypothetical protein BGX28_002950, partial [Mortierella sp. GBA30]